MEREEITAAEKMNWTHWYMMEQFRDFVIDVLKRAQYAKDMLLYDSMDAKLDQKMTAIEKTTAQTQYDVCVCMATDMIHMLTQTNFSIENYTDLPELIEKIRKMGKGENGTYVYE